MRDTGCVYVCITRMYICITKTLIVKIFKIYIVSSILPVLLPIRMMSWSMKSPKYSVNTVQLLRGLEWWVYNSLLRYLALGSSSPDIDIRGLATPGKKIILLKNGRKVMFIIYQKIKCLFRQLTETLKVAKACNEIIFFKMKGVS